MTHLKSRVSAKFSCSIEDKLIYSGTNIHMECINFFEKVHKIVTGKELYQSASQQLSWYFLCVYVGVWSMAAAWVLVSHFSFYSVYYSILTAVHWLFVLSLRYVFLCSMLVVLSSSTYVTNARAWLSQTVKQVRVEHSWKRVCWLRKVKAERGKEERIFFTSLDVDVCLPRIMSSTCYVG